MALLVTDQGEIDSLRTLLNATHQIPRNLVLKLYTGPSTPPTEQDVPSATKYFEPYNASNTSGYGSVSTTGYDVCVNNRTEEDQDFSQQYGILLNGNRWTIGTTTSGQGIPKTFSGTTGTYQIVVSDNDDLKKGDYVTAASGIPANTYVVDIDGNNIEISQKLTATITAGTACTFAVGRTTASYPEQIFTFQGAAGNVYGYYLARANNMPVALHGVVDGLSIAPVGTSIEKAGCKGVIGQTYIELLETDFTQAIDSGAANSFVINVAAGGNLASIAVGQRVTGTGIATQTRVSGIDGENIYLDKALTGAASGNATFTPDVAADLTVGQRVTKTGGGGQGGPDAFPADTVITGIDYSKQTGEIGPKVFLNKQLVDNVGTASSNDKVDFDHSVITTDPSGSAVAHGLNPGDVIYIAQGTTSDITAAHYTVHTTPTTSTFTTTPAMQQTNTAAQDGTAYSSIFFAEQFTNGPYAIQNNGDQIKVTLNVSLD